MYSLKIFNYGKYNKGHSSARIFNGEDGVWASEAFPQNITPEQAQEIKEQLEFACKKFGVILNTDDPSIHEWYIINPNKVVIDEEDEYLLPMHAPKNNKRKASPRNR